MLRILDAGMQSRHRVIGAHIDRDLGHDGAVVDLLVDEMNRDPGRGDAVVDPPASGFLAGAGTL